MNLCFNIILFFFPLCSVNIWDILYEILNTPPSETRRPSIPSPQGSGNDFIGGEGGSRRLEQCQKIQIIFKTQSEITKLKIKLI